MPVTRHDKLVRDLIPDIIRQRGGTPVTAILSAAEYQARLAAKLLEETNEYLESEDVEELADIAEVIDALLACHGVSRQRFARIKAAKRVKRGAFHTRTLLTEVRED